MVAAALQRGTAAGHLPPRAPLMTIGPRQTAASSSAISRPMLMARSPQRCAGTSCPSAGGAGGSSDDCEADGRNVRAAEIAVLELGVPLLPSSPSLTSGLPLMPSIRGTEGPAGGR